MRYLAVKNFERFQHYKDRSTFSWIKLHASLLSNYDFQSLPDKSKGHLMLIWLLVSQRPDRRIPDDPRWVAQKIGATDKVDLKILVENGWLISLDSPYQTEKAAVPDPSLSSPPSDLSSPDLKNGNGNGNGHAPEAVSPEDLVEGWNRLCAVPLGLVRVQELSESRRTQARKRLREHPQPDFWETVFANIRGSPLLRGQRPAKREGDRPWRVDFDWLIENDRNALKVKEGKYIG